MLPRRTLATAKIPEGEVLTLVSHGQDFIIMAGSQELMSSRMKFSEEQLSLLTLKELGKQSPTVLIGGYGMGFTFRAALSVIGENGKVVVAEIVPDILDWSRGPLAELNGDCLEDPRAQVVFCDVAALIDDANDGTSQKFDAILLDVDNGPHGLVREANNRLYSRTGIAKAKDALNPGGILTVWSANQDHKFTRRLKESGFRVEVRELRARPNNKGPRHYIWFAKKP